MKNRIKKILKILLFCLIVVVGIRAMSDVWHYSDETHTREIFDTFYSQPKNSVDIVWIGASAVQTSIMPNYIYEKTGVRVCTLATASQPFFLAKYLIEESEKTQNPKIYYVDLRMLIYECDISGQKIVSENYLRHVSDNMPLSINKINMLNEAFVELEKQNPNIKIRKEEYFFPILKYHDRWEEGIRISKTPDKNMGFYSYNGCIVQDKTNLLKYKETMPGGMTEYNKQYLLEVIDYCEQNNVNVVFTWIPCNINAKQYGILNEAKEIISSESNYYVWDMEYDIDEIGIDYSKDFAESMHFNIKGAKKLSKYIVKKIRTMKM